MQNNQIRIINQSQKLLVSVKNDSLSISLNLEVEQSGQTKQSMSMEQIVVKLLFRGSSTQYSTTLELSAQSNHINLNYDPLRHVWFILQGDGLIIP